MTAQERAVEALSAWRGDGYAFGREVLGALGPMAARHGRRAMVVANDSPSRRAVIEECLNALKDAGMELVPAGLVPGAPPNSPREDVYRIEGYILHFNPDVVIVIGGGSSIDAVKAANALATLGVRSPELEPYFGTGLVTEALEATGLSLRPLIAVQTASSSGSHLTKYSNVTDPVAGQKKLIVDTAIVPDAAVFDYNTTATMPEGLTIDGALDGFGHCLEVYYGSTPETRAKTAAIALPALELIVNFTKRAVDNPDDMEAREALGLATDLGGYAIMVGGTSGAHLTSFSLVDVTTHGRACGIMNPYYTVFFAPAIQEQLVEVGRILADAGFMDTGDLALGGRALGEAVANGMLAFNRSIGAAWRLSDLPAFNDSYIDKALKAAKNPQLESKLRNMPVPLSADLVDEYMGPVLRAAAAGDFGLIRNMG